MNIRLNDKRRYLTSSEIRIAAFLSALEDLAISMHLSLIRTAERSPPHPLMHIEIEWLRKKWHKKRRLLQVVFSMCGCVHAFIYFAIFSEVHEDGCNLCTDRSAQRCERGVRTAGDQVVLVCPLHRRGCAAADLIRIGVRSERHATDSRRYDRCWHCFSQSSWCRPRLLRRWR